MASPIAIPLTEEQLLEKWNLDLQFAELLRQKNSLADPGKFGSYEPSTSYDRLLRAREYELNGNKCGHRIYFTKADIENLQVEVNKLREKGDVAECKSYIIIWLALILAALMLTLFAPFSSARVNKRKNSHQGSAREDPD